MTTYKENDMRVLPRSFYLADSAQVAPRLLGKILVHRIGEEMLVGRIVETEAYLAHDDPAAHNFIGKTSRNAALYADAGHTYVHAMRHHYLLDIVTEPINQPGSVLIRALEPIDGIAMMQTLRDTADLRRLTSGPARLCQALGIDSRLNFHDITDEHSSLFIAKDDLSTRVGKIGQSTRIGISKNAEAMLRFFIQGNPFVSKG